MLPHSHRFTQITAARYSNNLQKGHYYGKNS